MLVRLDGSFITARRHPGLQRVTARFDGDTLWLTHDDQTAIAQSRRMFELQRFHTGIWGDEFPAWTTSIQLDAWFARIVGEPVHLLWLGEQSARYRRPIDRRVSFADGYPLLLTSQASLDDLNQRSDGSHVMAQFRPSIVATGTHAFAEDGWRRIRVGDVVFRVVEPCARCVMITVDPARGQRRPDGEPMKTLLGYRKREANEVHFGQNLVAENTGEIALDQPIDILE